jgi:hypothetical protein
VLEHVTNGTGVQRAGDMTIVAERGEHDDAHVGIGGHDPASGFDAVDDRHEIHEHDVGVLAGDRGDRLLAVRRDPYEVDVAGGGEQLFEPAA